MHKPNLRNHHRNLLKQQARLVLSAIRTAADPRVIETVRHSTLARLVEGLPELTAQQQRLLDQWPELKTADEFQQYELEWEPYVAEFPLPTEKQLKKLFPKNKKLKMPELDEAERRYLTYLGWNDIGTNRMFWVYELDGQLVGIEGRCTPLQKKGVCFVCQRNGETALFTAHVQGKPSNADPDYYKAVGHYVCLDSAACNRQLVDEAPLASFFRTVVGSRR